MDRISKLGDDLIFEIFRFMPMKDVVRTTTLSTRWLNLWTKAPFLHFDCTGEIKTETSVKFINRALLRWDGVSVEKFELHSLNNADDSTYADVSLWVHFAKRHRVKELHLHMKLGTVNWPADEDRDVFWVPQCLYSCSALTDLSITNCYFGHEGNVQWNKLKSLTICGGFGVTQHVIDRILSGSPRLEVLVLSFVERCESLSIQSSSLKELSIYKHLCLSIGLSDFGQLEILTPSVETFEIKGIPYSKCLLRDVSSLNHATLGFSGLHPRQVDYHFSENGLLATNNLLEDLFSEILPSIRHVETVTLWSCCVMVLVDMINRCMNSSSPNVKSVQLGFRASEQSQVVGIIEIFPQLKKLVLKYKKEDEYHDNIQTLPFDANIYLKFQEYLPKSFLQQLETVEFTWVKGYDVFPLLRFLLRSASKLEKMVFRKEFVPPSSRSYLRTKLRKLLSIIRKDGTVQFIRCPY